ncbi:hypothetical protein Adt_22695 [Abeliophyllum distichum]|uniref:Uncharacterized protein n=1 Tax=Abeliophyllum distichum TaxID=126358 RepID=A0ABD1S935_9LAMI
MASPTGTRQSLLFHSKEQASLKRLSHWDSAIALVPFKGTSLAPWPLPLGLSNRSCSIQRNKPRSMASPTGTRQSLLFHSKEQASLKRLSHWNSAIAQLFPPPTTQIKARRPHKCPSRPLWDLFYL